MALRREQKLGTFQTNVSGTQLNDLDEVDENPSKNPPLTSNSHHGFASTTLHQSEGRLSSSDITMKHQALEINSSVESTVHSPASTIDESYSQWSYEASQESKEPTASSSNPPMSIMTSSYIFEIDALKTSRPAILPTFNTKSPVSKSSSVISVVSESINSQVSSTCNSSISGSSSQFDFEEMSPIASQISESRSLSPTDSHSYSDNEASPTRSPSQRVSIELPVDLEKCIKPKLNHDEVIGRRITATEIQKLLVIPKGLVTQKDYGKSKAGIRIIPPPHNERHYAGEHDDDTKSRMTVTELQKHSSYANGSYAWKLIELLDYNTFKYSTWATAKNREESLAIIEIESITRNMGLQWAKCIVVSNKAFDLQCGYTSARAHTIFGKTELSDKHKRSDPVFSHVGVEMQLSKALNKPTSMINGVQRQDSLSSERLPIMGSLCSLQCTGRQEYINNTKVTIEPSSTVDIVFSNLFNHSTLKVADRVEIYEPCRPIAISSNNKVVGDEVIPTKYVWVVERYIAR
ncbi:hypothetical protein FBU30_009575 [Linnemannia zychae]|nr:hypothetical protein FBU30_009575 [Linnemannia zychae]